MSTIGERIRMVRESVGKNGGKMPQAEFGEIIGIGGSGVGNHERGETTPSTNVIRAICKAFNVNEIWLRTGEGEMFGEQSREDEIMSFVADVLNDDKSLKAKFLQALIEMRDEDLELILKLAKKLAED